MNRWRQFSAPHRATAAGAPSINPSRCVHDRIGRASCQACVAACPRAAWVIDGERLGLDLAACDGCGLCVPACPEGAIAGGRQAERAPARQLDGQAVRLLACERAAVAVDPAQIPWVPCVHAIGERELLRAWRQDQPLWLISIGDCAACPRGGAPHLCQRMAGLNALLQSRGLPPITLIRLGGPSWLDRLQQSRLAEEPCTRRNWLRQALGTVLNMGLELAGGEDSDENESATVAAPTACLPDGGAGALFAWTPILDPNRCNGCDACIRLCPHQALKLESAMEPPAYRIEARQCTGCGLCRDVCDQNALRLVALQPQTQRLIPLWTGHCPACGAPYHLPINDGPTPRWCPICARARHGRQLYQVLK